MATTCPHGFPPDRCLICETLAASRGGAPLPTVAGGTPARATPARATPARATPAPATPTGTGAPGAAEVAPPVGRRRHLNTSSAVLVGLAVILVLGVGWAVAGLVFAVLRILELVAAVVVAGGVGHRIGLAQGRREGRREGRGGGKGGRRG